MTPDKLREWATYIAGGSSRWPIPEGMPKPSEIFRAHAAALEELAATKADYKSCRNDLAESERRAERLEGHAEAMANAIQFGDMAILTVAKAAADSYRSDYPKDPK